MKYLAFVFFLSSYLLLGGATTLTVNTGADNFATTGGTFSSMNLQGDLRGALNYVNENAVGSYTVVFSLASGKETISLNGSLPILNLTAANTLVIDGSNTSGSGLFITIDGGTAYPAFLARQGIIAIENMIIQNTNAHGGFGGGGSGGGGMGAGGALFVDQAANVTLLNMGLSTNGATGGNGATGAVSGLGGGGGGGMGGNGGQSLVIGMAGGGGGGGLGGNGGGSFSVNAGAGGGGIGLAQNASNIGAGGGSGAIGNAGSGFGAAAGGSAGAGAGGADAGGGAGGNTGGAGGGGGVAGSSASGITGGAGGYGGGGGGGQSVTSGGVAGAGNLGGGGGGSGEVPTTGGSGGYGGGGGGKSSTSTSIGGFGGGGGGGIQVGGTGILGAAGGTGGGTGGNASATGGGGGGGGGGGAGLGGAIFVRNGGMLTIQGGVSTEANTAAPGAGGAPTSGGSGTAGTAGASACTDLFLESSSSGITVTIAPANGTSVTLTGSIGDDSSNTLPGGTYTAGTGVGAVLLKSGLGTLFLQGANSYTGNTQISQGTVSVASATPLGAGSVEFTNNGTLAFSANIPSFSVPILMDAAVVGTIDAGSSTSTIASSISGSGGLNVACSGGGVLHLSNLLGNTYLLSTTVTSGTLVIDTIRALPVSPPLTVNATLDLSALTGQTVTNLSGTNTAGEIILPANNPLTVTQNASLSYAGIFTGSGSLVKQGSATLSLSNTGSNYSGGTSIQAGTLQLLASNAIPLGSNVSLATSGILDLNGYAQTIGNLTGDGSETTQILLGSGILTVDPSTTSTFDGQITQGGSLIKTGTFTFILSNGNNNYSGGTIVNQGILELDTTHALPLGGNVTLNGGTLFLNGTTQQVGNLTAALGSQVSLGSGHLIVTSSSDTSCNGTITGVGGSLAKMGNASFTLSQTNNYTGSTTVSGGTLIVNGSIATSFLTTVNVGGTLKGNNGTVGPLTVQGSLIPGLSIGTLNINGPLELDSSSVTQIQINNTGATSLLAVTGMVTIESGATLQVAPTKGLYLANTSWVFVTSSGLANNTHFQFTSALLPPLLVEYNVPAMGSISFFLPVSVLAGGIPTTGLSGNLLILVSYLNTLTINVPSLLEILTELSELPTQDLINALISIDPLGVSSTTLMLANVQFAFNDLLFSRLTNQRLLRRLPSFISVPVAVQEKRNVEQLMALASRPSFCDEESQEPLLAARTKSKEKPSMTWERFGWAERYSIWGQVFGLFSHEVGEDSNPSFHTISEGFFAAFDSAGWDFALAGAGVGFAHNALRQTEGLGKSFSDMAVASLYGSYFLEPFFLDWACWGGYSWIQSERHVVFSGFDAYAKGHFHCWQITPHIDLGATFLFSHASVEPFASLDWPILFTSSLIETGAAPLNMHLYPQTSSLPRVRCGFNFFKQVECESGIFVAKQTLSYIYQKPLSIGRVDAFIVGMPGSFTVQTFLRTQNLFSPTVELFFKSNSGGFVSVSYQGEFGKDYMANEVLGNIGLAF